MSGLVEVSVDDLIGPALDWATGCAVRSPYLGVGSWAGSRDAWLIDWSRQSCYSPSTDWSHGGPLIEQHKVATRFSAGFSGQPAFWQAQIGAEPFEFIEMWQQMQPIDANQFGETALIAACRAIVAAKLAEVVLIPSELVQAVQS